MQKVSQQTGDDLAQAEDILAKVKWAQSSDVKFQASSQKATPGVQSRTTQPAKKEEANSKKIEEILRFYDRCKEHNCAQILVTAHVEFPKGVLDMLSKLRVFSRKLGPLKCEVCGESGLAFGLKLAYLRLKTGQMDVSRTARKLEFDDYDALKGPTRGKMYTSVRNLEPRSHDVANYKDIFKCTHATCHHLGLPATSPTNTLLAALFNPLNHADLIAKDVEEKLKEN